MFLGIVLICMAVIILTVTFVVSRSSSPPKWASELMVQYVWGIVIVALFGTGFPMVIMALFGDTPIAMQEYLLSLLTAAVTAIFVKLFGFNKKLTAYANARHAA